jgi:hypothetical protein
MDQRALGDVSTRQVRRMTPGLSELLAMNFPFADPVTEDAAECEP